MKLTHRELDAALAAARGVGRAYEAAIREERGTVSYVEAKGALDRALAEETATWNKLRYRAEQTREAELVEASLKVAP